MNECPFCLWPKSSPYALEFRCGTTGRQHQSQITWERSQHCYERQLTQYARLVKEMWEFIHPVDRKLFISRPEVKAILNDQQTFIGSESIGVTDEDFEVYYPKEGEDK